MHDYTARYNILTTHNKLTVQEYKTHC